MKYNWLMLVLVLLASCTGVSVYRHPDYSFPPTDPANIRVYLPDQEPTYTYVIIGRITMDFSWTVDTGAAERKVAKLAAQAGADGVVISQVNVDIYQFNQHVHVYGYTSPGEFTAFIQPHSLPYKQIIVQGYLIKWVRE